MKTRVFILLVLSFSLWNCKSENPSKKNTNLGVNLDSIEKANNQSVLDSGTKITKAYIYSNEGQKYFHLIADMRRDHRFYGYAQPDSKSDRLILFSIFSNDVDGNPFQMPLGSYYSSSEMDSTSIRYVGETKDFIETELIKNKQDKTTVYFEKNWVEFEEDFPDDDYNTEVPDDAIRDFGLVEKVEDGAYPMYTVTVEFVERNFRIDFNLNIESVSIDSNTLNGLVGKYATLYYTSDWIENLHDLYYQKKSLSGTYAPEIQEDWTKITGILSDANTLSGDLPSIITITDSEGTSMTFEWFVDSKVIEANGKEVTAYYSGKAINTIVEIEPSEDQ